MQALQHTILYLPATKTNFAIACEIDSSMGVVCRGGLVCGRRCEPFQLTLMGRAGGQRLAVGVSMIRKILVILHHQPSEGVSTVPAIDVPL